MDDGLRLSKISWMITIFVVIGNLITGKLGLPALMIVCWGTISLFALIAGIVFGIKGIKAGKQNNNKSAVTQGRVGVVLNSIILAMFLFGTLTAILVNIKN